jgi:UDPglucose 6-dehydrogenase
VNVTVIGAGYVGLTTGVMLAALGHKVTCLDVDEHKLEQLRCGMPTIYEPHLEDLLLAVMSNLMFTSDYTTNVPQAEVIFITVGTPSLPDGNPDLRYLRAAAQSIGQNLGEHFTVVVNKSTVPIGSGNWVESLIQDAFQDSHQKLPASLGVASNPEFLKEGTALHDSFFPDRIVVGSDSTLALDTLEKLYQPLIDQSFDAPKGLTRPLGFAKVPFVKADLASAELIKYAANAFLSTKISFINEISELAEKVGADVQQVARGIGLDARIGSKFLHAGIGWGGSCFAKDTSALVATAREYGLSMPIIQAAKEVNARQRARIVEKLLSELKILKGKTIAILGLAFKPNTDDLRDAPALEISRRLEERGAKVKAHDPIAMPRFLLEMPDSSVVLCESALAAMTGADAVVLVTEWSEYRDLDWAVVQEVMRGRFVVDGRNFLDRAAIEGFGLRYEGMGR